MKFLTYDAASHLADAVIAGGASREALRESLRRTSEIELAVIAAGRWKRLGADGATEPD